MEREAVNSSAVEDDARHISPSALHTSYESISSRRGEVEVTVPSSMSIVQNIGAGGILCLFVSSLFCGFSSVGGS